MDFDKAASVRNQLRMLGIDDYLNRDGITELIINRPNELFLERPTGWERIEDERLSLRALEQFANTLCIFNGKNINQLDPMHSVTLPDGERGHILIPPSCEQDTIVFALRKPSDSRFTLDSYIDSGRLAKFKDVADYSGSKESSIDIESSAYRDVCDKMKLPNDVKLQDWQLKMLEHKSNRELNPFFQLAIEHKLNICMVGGTGSGKTTFTKAVADMIPSDVRILTIEDTHELSLPNHPNHAHLFYKQNITAKAVISSCMRLKPDRIFLTELRGDEAWDYLSALNTGHQGGLTSVHANDANSVFYRISQLAKESVTGQTMDFDYILNTVRSTIDVVCFFDKTYMTELYFDPVAKYYALTGK
jgi:type IV secretion system protein VirB11